MADPQKFGLTVNPDGSGTFHLMDGADVPLPRALMEPFMTGMHKMATGMVVGSAEAATPATGPLEAPKISGPMLGSLDGGLHRDAGSVVIPNTFTPNDLPPIGQSIADRNRAIKEAAGN